MIFTDSVIFQRFSDNCPTDFKRIATNGLTVGGWYYPTAQLEPLDLMVIGPNSDRSNKDRERTAIRTPMRNARTTIQHYIPYRPLPSHQRFGYSPTAVVMMIWEGLFFQWKAKRSMDHLLLLPEENMGFSFQPKSDKGKWVHMGPVYVPYKILYKNHTHTHTRRANLEHQI